MRPLLLVLFLSSAALAQDPVQGIITLFDTYRIVMLGEIHESKQEYDLLRKLVATPGFSDRVNDIVMEFGNARYQDVVDRYIAGENVPLAQVQKAWQDTVGALGPASPVYGEFYAAVRVANLKLPKDRRMRVLLGDPPIDWSQVQTREDIGPFLPFRDSFYASVVRYQVIAKKRKALLIMGEGHFRRNNGRPAGVESELLMSFVQPFIILPGGFDRTDATVAPSLLPKLDLSTDAVLYLGPRDKLTVVKNRREDLDATPYGKELERRLAIIFDQPPDFLPKAGDPQEQPAFSRTPGSPPPFPVLPKPHP
jgi:hypothetical protein